MAANNQKLHVFGLGHMYHTVLYVDADVIATSKDAGAVFEQMAGACVSACVRRVRRVPTAYACVHCACVRVCAVGSE